MHQCSHNNRPSFFTFSPPSSPSPLLLHLLPSFFTFSPCLSISLSPSLSFSLSLSSLSLSLSLSGSPLSRSLSLSISLFSPTPCLPLCLLPPPFLACLPCLCSVGLASHGVSQTLKYSQCCACKRKNRANTYIHTQAGQKCELSKMIKQARKQASKQTNKQPTKQTNKQTKSIQTKYQIKPTKLN